MHICTHISSGPREHVLVKKIAKPAQKGLCNIFKNMIWVRTYMVLVPVSPEIAPWVYTMLLCSSMYSKYKLDFGSRVVGLAMNTIETLFTHVFWTRPYGMVCKMFVFRKILSWPLKYHSGPRKYRFGYIWIPKRIPLLSKMWFWLHMYSKKYSVVQKNSFGYICI